MNATWSRRNGDVTFDTVTIPAGFRYGRLGATIASLGRMFLDGRHLKSARVMAAMSRQDLADAADISVSAVKYWERSASRLPSDGYAAWHMYRALRRVGVVAEIGEVDGLPVAIIRSG